MYQYPKSVINITSKRDSETSLRIIDFHTHILPGIDDGSKSLAESIQMLETSKQQGIQCVVLTPHFCAEKDTPAHFFQKRAESLHMLRAEWKDTVPILLPGAEVQYFSGIAHMKEILQFCVWGTDILLLEMPFCKWSSRVVEDVLTLQNDYPVQVVVAHIERYQKYQDKSVIKEMLGNRVLFQANADFFLNWSSRYRAINMLKKGQIHFLGSDCHNMSSRPQQLGACYRLLCRRLGNEAVNRFINNNVHIMLHKKNEILNN